MVDVIKLVQGDSRPSLIITVTDKTTGNPLNLTGTRPVLKFRELDGTQVLGEIPGALIDPVNGCCVFHWTAVPGILDGFPGNYEGEIEITYDDSTVQTVYERIYFYLREQF